MINTWGGRLEEITSVSFVLTSVLPKWYHAASHWEEIHLSIFSIALPFTLALTLVLALSFHFHLSPLLLPFSPTLIFLSSLLSHLPSSLHLLYPSFPLSLSPPLSSSSSVTYGANSGASWQFSNCFMRYCRSRCAAQKRVASSVECLMSGGRLYGGWRVFPPPADHCEMQRLRKKEGERLTYCDAE